MEDILATKAGPGKKIKILLPWTSEGKLKSLVDGSRDPLANITNAIWRRCKKHLSVPCRHQHPVINGSPGVI